jgi:hypothetical protein
VRAIEELGYHGVSADDLVAMRIHGVTPEYIRQMRQIGLTGKVSVDDWIALRIHGVDPDEARRYMRDDPSSSADDMVSRKIHGARS